MTEKKYSLFANRAGKSRADLVMRMRKLLETGPSEKAPTKVLVLHPEFIRQNYDWLQKDCYYWPFDDTVTLEQFLAKAERGEVVIGGAKVVIQRNLPHD